MHLKNCERCDEDSDDASSDEASSDQQLSPPQQQEEQEEEEEQEHEQDQERWHAHEHGRGQGSACVACVVVANDVCLCVFWRAWPQMACLRVHQLRVASPYIKVKLWI